MHRRDISKALLAAAAGSALLERRAEAQSGAAPQYPRTPAEVAAGLVPSNYSATVTPTIDVLRYGIVPNDPKAASQNTARLRALVDPKKKGPMGELVFPPMAGGDVYHFDGFIAFRDGIHIRGNGCELSCKKKYEPADNYVGFLYAIRDFSIDDLTIRLDYDGSAGVDAGAAIRLGNRKSEGAYFPNSFDALMPAPQGNISLRRVKIISNNPLGNAILALGGLQNVELDVRVDGQGALAYGLQYEYGFATNEAQVDQRQSSHANNWKIWNFIVENLNVSSSTSSAGIQLTGAYNVHCFNLVVRRASQAFVITPGEALYHRPWVGVDDVGAKWTITFENVVGSGLVGNGMVVTGQQSVSKGKWLLSSLVAKLSHPEDYKAQTDLVHVVINSFSIKTTAAGAGLQSSAGSIYAAHGRITGAQRGIVTTNECTHFEFDMVEIEGCTQYAMQLGIDANVWSPKRQKMGIIRNCRLHGNSTEAAGRFEAVHIENCDGVRVECNRVGYDLIEDGRIETTQGHAFGLAAGAKGVVFDSNNVGSVHEGSVAYFNRFDSAAGNDIRNARGLQTTSGSWDRDGMSFANSTNLASKMHPVNTTGKYLGRRVYDTTNKRLMIAQGAANTSKWEVADGSGGSGSVTPL